MVKTYIYNLCAAILGRGKSTYSSESPKTNDQRMLLSNGYSSQLVRSGHCGPAVCTLQELCEDLCVATPLDHTLLEMWDNYVPPLKLFPQVTPDTPTGGCGSNITSSDTTNESLQEDKHLLQESFLFKSSNYDNSPSSSPDCKRARTIATPTSITKTRRRIGF